MCQAIDASGIRLVVCDYDGTMGGSAIADSMLTFLIQPPKGVQFTVASGRVSASLAALGVSALCTAPIITEGGGRIIDHVTGSTLFARPVQDETLRDFENRVTHGEVDLLYACFGAEKEFGYTFFLPAGSTIPSRYAANARIIRTLPEFLLAASRDKACKINFRTIKHTERPSWPGVHWNEGSADLMAKEVDKGTAIQWICERLGIRLTEVLVVGNDHNDRPMFQLEGPMKIIVGKIFPPEEASQLRVHLLVDTPEHLGETLRTLFQA